MRNPDAMPGSRATLNWGVAEPLTTPPVAVGRRLEAAGPPAPTAALAPSPGNSGADGQGAAVAATPPGGRRRWRSNGRQRRLAWLLLLLLLPLRPLLLLLLLLRLLLQLQLR